MEDQPSIALQLVKQLSLTVHHTIRLFLRCNLPFIPDLLQLHSFVVIVCRRLFGSSEPGSNLCERGKDTCLFPELLKLV
uniref:Uncharacterized protein n=1 Tax=Raphanus sativus TaxID=3726 RepID=A0A650GAD3_RAPSA|nr:hypothetical protein [Raphanus sativus]QGW48572.1 hypothetical protein [Raphanus sativus]